MGRISVGDERKPISGNGCKMQIAKEEGMDGTV